MRCSCVADLVAATRRPRRYMLVGLICAAIYNAIIIAGDMLGIHYMITLVVSVLILAPTAYTLHSLFTFERGMERMLFLRFAGAMLAAFPINFALMVLLVSGLGLRVPVATLLCTGLLFGWNYLSARWAIVPRRARKIDGLT